MDSVQEMTNRKRVREDKISKLMGDYLLKGYKMLGSTCSTCGTILLRDRQGQDYCVACSEVDTITPAVSRDVSDNNSNSHNVAIMEELKDPVTNNCDPDVQITVKNKRVEQHFHGTAVKLEERISWATSQLGCGNSVEMDIKLSELIYTCGKALKALRELQE